MIINVIIDWVLEIFCYVIYISTILKIREKLLIF